MLAATLGNEYFRYDEKARSLVGDDTGETYRVGQRLQLRLAEANPASGALRFELPEGKGAPPERRDRMRTTTRRGANPRGRPANIRHQGQAVTLRRSDHGPLSHRKAAEQTPPMLGRAAGPDRPRDRQAARAAG